MKDKQDDLDDIVVRIFDQGVYWGTGAENPDGKLNPDYKPKRPIDRTEAKRALDQYITDRIEDELNSAFIQAEAYAELGGGRHMTDMMRYLSDRAAELRGKSND